MSQVGTRSEVILPVRWVVVFTGSKATEDYQPTASAAESPGLVREIAEMCVAFHPHTDIRHFPQDGDAILFWRARSTQDWVVTRVTVAPNPQGLRTALEYCSVVFSDAAYAEIGRNPFHVRDLHLHEKVRQQYMSKRLEPLEFDLTGTTVVVRGGTPTDSNGTERRTPNLTGGNISTPENYRALVEYCRIAEEQGRTPQTLATWWSSHSEPPAGYFEVVLKAASPKPLTLREVIAEIKKINGDTKDTIPSVSSEDTVAGELSRSILVKSDLLVSSVDTIAARSNVDSVPEYQASMAEAASQAGQIGSDLERFRTRLTEKVDTTTLDQLTALSSRYQVLSKELTRVPHPDPFRPVDNTVSKTIPKNVPQRPTPKAVATTEETRSAPNPALIGGAIAAVGLIATAALVLKPGNNTKPDPSTKPSAKASAVASDSGAKPTATKQPETTDPVQRILAPREADVVPLAKAAAQEAGRERGLNGEQPDESETRRIALRAIREGYRKVLSETDYDRVFGSRAWDFGKFDKELPKLATEAKAAVAVGVTSGIADRKIKQAQAAAKAAQEQVRPEPTPRPRREAPDPPRRPRREDPDPPRRASKPSSSGGSGGSGGGGSTKPKPAGGSAGSTDL